MRSEDEPQPPLWVGGGTDLMLKPPLPDQPLAPLPAALPIQRHGESLKVDAAMTWSQLQADPLWQEHFPGLSHFFQTFASAPIRDSGTLGGNLVNASPIGDGAILFLAAGIQVETDRGRTLDIDHFFLSYRQTALHQGERLTQLILPLHGRVYFSKVTKRPLLDVASVNAALWLGARPNGSPHIRLSVGGLSPTPKRLVEAEEWLQTYWPCGEPTLPWRGLQERLAHATAPIDDIRGSAEYKQTLVFRLLLDLIGQATSPSKVTREILVT
jgi:xanthine dehydrogenase small subunit